MNSNKRTWAIKKSQRKYKNSWIEVVEDLVIDDHGRELMYGVVRIAKGTCVLPLDDEGFVYLAKQFRYGLGDFSVECPGGAIDKGETLLAAAKRELKEELGISPTRWIELGHINPLTGVITHTEYLYLARGFDPPQHIPYSTEEVIEMIRVTLEEAVRMVMDSKITHGPSAALILKANCYLESYEP